MGSFFKGTRSLDFRRHETGCMTGAFPIAQDSSQTPKPTLDENPWYSLSSLWQRKTTVIAALSISGILLHVILRFGVHATAGAARIPLLATLVIGGSPLL